MFWTIETIASFQRVVNGNQEKKDLISPRADVPFSWRLSEDIKLQGSKMVMVGPPSWLESCANAVGSWLENPVRSRWCCARPLLCRCFGTGRATCTRTEVGSVCQSYYLGFGAGNAAEMTAELKEDEEPAADRVWGTGGWELAGDGGFTACVDGRLSQQRASPHCWMLVCRVCCRLLGTMSECFAYSVITLCMLCLLLWLVVGFGAHADSQQLG